MKKPKVKIKIKHAKRRGEWAEMRFMAMATENGIEVAKPYGEMARYDFVVEHEGKFARVQVKSTMYRNGRGYACTMRGWRDPYGRNEFDYVAVYLILEDLWYIVPAKTVLGKWSIALCPYSRKAKYAPYREAWHLLRGSRRRVAGFGPSRPAPRSGRSLVFGKGPTSVGPLSHWKSVRALAPEASSFVLDDFFQQLFSRDARNH